VWRTPAWLDRLLPELEKAPSQPLSRDANVPPSTVWASKLYMAEMA